ncbi:MAG: PEGA domain-containing protein [Chloroflexi bacterium]|nr:MAG: PEGA domain-containing protein [Chloroflexota bacterium]
MKMYTYRDILLVALIVLFITSCSATEPYQFATATQFQIRTDDISEYYPRVRAEACKQMALGIQIGNSGYAEAYEAALANQPGADTLLDVKLDTRNVSVFAFDIPGTNLAFGLYAKRCFVVSGIPVALARGSTATITSQKNATHSVRTNTVRNTGKSSDSVNWNELFEFFKNEDAPRTSLTIETVPPNARIYFVDVYEPVLLGISPITIMNIPEGVYEFMAELEGYHGQRKKVRLRKTDNGSLIRFSLLSVGENQNYKAPR